MVNRKSIDMTKIFLNTIILLFLFILPVRSQTRTQEAPPKREVTLYNPYKPSLPESKKRSFLPDMTDTLKLKKESKYEVKADAYLPSYTISPIKAASLLPDPLTKLYKSYVNIGMGNYITPLAEISITNERSKKGSIGFYGKHLSSSGKVELQNGEKVFAGFMDNDVSVFGRKVFRKNVFGSSVDFLNKTRYAYGYDTSVTGYTANKKDIRLPYYNAGAKASLSSLTRDSSDFAYDFDVSYNFFSSDKNLYQHSAGIKGMMAKTFKDFYVGSEIGYNFYKISENLLVKPKFAAYLNPFISKNTPQWNFKLGFKALLERNMDPDAVFHIYPDVKFGFSIVPSYINFFAGLSGKLEENLPLNVISTNPFIRPDGSLFTLPNTNHELIVAAGLKGNNGLGGEYLVSASYSIISDMLFFSNLALPGSLTDVSYGNYFMPFKDDAELLNIHGEINGDITDKLSFEGRGGFYKYTLATSSFAWNKPAWDASAGLSYNLKDKIIAGMDVTAEGKRRLLVFSVPEYQFLARPFFNINLHAEYRYSKILSFWTKFNNISFNRYYEWAYYPSQRFMFMVGFTYSL